MWKLATCHRNWVLGLYLSANCLHGDGVLFAAELEEADICRNETCRPVLGADKMSEGALHDSEDIPPPPSYVNDLKDFGAYLADPDPAAVDLSAYDHVDPGHLIPARPRQLALAHFERRKDKIPNPRYLAIADFSRRSSTGRLFVVNMASGSVETISVAHGAGSDPDADGYAEHFSNTPESKMTSLGLYSTAEIYDGKYGRSLRLDGLQTSNSKARSRAIVMHAADYVYSDGRVIGRSWGCLALDWDVKDRILTELAQGALIYAWYDQ